MFICLLYYNQKEGTTSPTTQKEVIQMKRNSRYEYAITMTNGQRYNVIGTSKQMVANELSLLKLPVANIERIYKSGKRSVCPW